MARGATSAAGAGFEIDPVGEYSLEESARFIGAWHEAPAEGGTTEGHLHLAFLTDAEWSPVGVCLTQSGAGRVVGTVYGDVNVEAATRQVARILSLDVDGRGWPGVGERDSVLAGLQRRYPGFRPVNWSNAYEAAAWCLISSRISMRQGQGVKDAMSRELGEQVDVHGQRLWVFPGPERLLRLEAFKGLFGRKVEYLNGLARAALAGALDTDVLRRLPRDESLRRLKAISGIGEFGSQLVRLRALSAVDELPNTEPRLAAAIRDAYGLDRDPGQAKLEELAESWKPFRMWACVYLRRAAPGGAGMMHSRASG